MAKNYKETPWWWYLAILVFSLILGLIAVIKENITLPAWAYFVSLILGIVVAPFVSISTYSTYLHSELSDNTVEHHSLFSLRQRYCHEQPIENASGSYAPWTPCW